MTSDAQRPYVIAFAVLCIVIGLGVCSMVAMTSPRHRKAVWSESALVSCERLVIVDAEGDPVMWLGTYDDGGPALIVRRKDGGVYHVNLEAGSPVSAELLLELFK